jgi:valyl-tRNA synthetase
MSLNDTTAEAPNGDGETKLSKKQLKKLAKGKSINKDKPKPTWGEGKKKKDDKASAISLPKKEYVNDTPKGEKKKLGEMEEAYHPRAVESAWQDWWEAR